MADRAHGCIDCGEHGDTDQGPICDLACHRCGTCAGTQEHLCYYCENGGTEPLDRVEQWEALELDGINSQGWDADRFITQDMLLDNVWSAMSAAEQQRCRAAAQVQDPEGSP